MNYFTFYSDSLKQVVPEALDYSDNTLVQTMMSLQGKSKRQAECAVKFLKMLGYNPVERFQLLHGGNAKVNFLCYFGSLWPLILIALILVFALAVGFFNFFWNQDDFGASSCSEKQSSKWF